MSAHRDGRDDREAEALLRHVPGPAPGAVARVARRLARGDGPRRAPVGRLLAGAGVLALAAAAAIVAVRVAAPPPATLDRPLASETAWSAHGIDDVALTFRGAGHLDGDARAPRLLWQRGTVHVEVTPDQGVDMVVETREAAVRVVGTGFSVTRDALGTRVEVRHGRVETHCGADAPVALGAGDTALCPPTSAAGLLGRARALRDAGAPTDKVLDALDRGLALAPAGDAVRPELAATRLRVLAESGRSAEALDAARALLVDGDAGARRDEAIALAVEVARAGNGCEADAPWLPGVDDAARAACAAP